MRETIYRTFKHGKSGYLRENSKMVLTQLKSAIYIENLLAQQTHRSIKVFFSLEMETGRAVGE